MTNIALTIDALTARVQFGQLLDKVSQKQKRFLISRRGKPQVVVLSVEDYMKNIIKQPQLLTRIQSSAADKSLNSITNQEIDQEIVSYRRSKK